MRMLVTGAGFIGSNFIRRCLRRGTATELVNPDKLTYAGNLDNLKEVARDPRYRFVRGDIADAELVNRPRWSGSTRSSTSPRRRTWTARSGTRAISSARTSTGRSCCWRRRANTGSGGSSRSRPTRSTGASKGSFRRRTRSCPATRTPRAGRGRPARLLVLGDVPPPGGHHPGLQQLRPVPYPEKVILLVTNALDDIPLPYGDGMNVRDWLFVDDHCAAIEFLLEKGADGEVYNIGGGNEPPTSSSPASSSTAWKPAS